MITIHQVRHAFGAKPVLDIPDMSFTEGRVHGIIGLNGAGKTTFFNLLAAYMKPDGGTILRDGAPTGAKEVGFLETGNYFYSGLTGSEYLGIFPATNTRFNLEALNGLLQLPLDEVVEGYSTGMKKKLALLAIIRQDKPVYIFDEPFNGLDLETNKAVELMLEALKARGKTVFISSHILSPLTAVCDEIHLLQHGHFTTSYGKAQFAAIEAALFADFNERAKTIVDGAL